MTKRHFIKFAAYIAAIQDRNIARELAIMVIRCQDNPAFDRTRFIRACGLEKEL